jgi:hypothetical protein
VLLKEEKKIEENRKIFISIQVIVSVSKCLVSYSPDSARRSLELM